MDTNLAYSTYSQNNVSIESPEKLIKMLYEGILRFSSQAKNAIENNDIEKRTYWINRTTAIFAELIHSLNDDGGQIAHYLRGLYTYQIRLLTEANRFNDPTRLDEVIKVAMELLQAWKDETENNDME